MGGLSKGLFPRAHASRANKFQLQLLDFEEFVHKECPLREAHQGNLIKSVCFKRRLIDFLIKVGDQRWWEESFPWPYGFGASMKSKHVVEELHDIDNTPLKVSCYQQEVDSNE